MGGPHLRIRSAALLAVLAVAALPAGLAGGPSADAVLFLHRDGSISASPPATAGDAGFTFGALPPHQIRFASAPLVRDWDLRGPAELELTLTSEYSVLGRLRATLDDGAREVAASDTNELLVDGRPEMVTLHFADLHGRVATGQRVGLNITLDPVAYVDLLGLPNLSLVDLKVDLVYDSTVHPSGLHVLGYDTGAPGGDAGSGGGPGGSGSNGANGGQGPGSAGGEPITLLSSAKSVPKHIMLMGLGSSGIALVAALMLRGRSGLG